MSFLFGKEQPQKEPLIDRKDEYIEFPSGHTAAMLVREKIKIRDEEERKKDEEARKAARHLLHFLLIEEFDTLCSNFSNHNPRKISFTINGDMYYECYKPHIHRPAFENELLVFIKRLGYVDCVYESSGGYMNITITIPEIKT
jgi:hypothetical protein